MKVLLYSKMNEVGKHLQGVIETISPDVPLEICRTIDSLTTELKRNLFQELIVVLLACSTDELSKMLMIRNLLNDLRVVMILPDEEPVTLAKAHTLYPRFLTNIKRDFEDVGAVLLKMIES